jgi:ribosome-binding protein aMBF1 (putative translation factor)
MKVDVRHHRLNVEGLSIDAFAVKVGVTADVIRNVETTGNRPRPANAVKLAKYFELTPDEMFEGDAFDSSESSPSNGKAAA